MRYYLKLAILKKYGSQKRFSEASGINEPRISAIIGGGKLFKDEEKIIKKYLSGRHLMLNQGVK